MLSPYTKFIDQALLAEGRFYSDLELTEKEIERMVMEASRAEYLAEDKLKQQLGFRESSTSGAEPSSSGASKLILPTDIFPSGVCTRKGCKFGEDLQIIFRSFGILISQ